MNPSERTHFHFGAPAKGGDSRLKLVVYFKNNPKPELRYSFDGRPNEAGTSIKAYDRSKFFNAPNALGYLENMFQKEFRYNSQLNYAFISDSGIVGKAGIKAVWDINGQMWVSKASDDAQRKQAHQVKKSLDCYTFRLAVPTLTKHPDPVKFYSFYTAEKDVGTAMLNLITQFQQYKKANPKLSWQERGQIYGNSACLFDRSEREVPYYCWFDVQKGQPKYKGTQKIVTGYDNIVKSNQFVEEFMSNI